MGTFIIELAEYLWILCIFSLLLTLLWPAGKSARITVLIWIVSNLGQDRLAPLLMGIADTDLELARLVWYPSWIFIQTATLVVIWRIHKMSSWPVEGVSKFICLTLLVHSIVQLARFTDRIVLGTDLLGELYKYGIPSLNIAAIFAIVLWSFKGLLTYRKGLSSC